MIVDINRALPKIFPIDLEWMASAGGQKEGDDQRGTGILHLLDVGRLGHFLDGGRDILLITRLYMRLVLVCRLGCGGGLLAVCRGLGGIHWAFVLGILGFGGVGGCGG